MAEPRFNSFFEKHYSEIENLRTQPGFSWEKVVSHYGLDTKPENLRTRYKDWRKKYTCSVQTDSNTSVTITTVCEKFAYLNGNEDRNKGTKTFSFTADYIPTEAEIVEHFNIDLSKWYINQIYHKTSFGGKYAITVSQLALKGNQVINITDKFLEDLKQVPTIPVTKTQTVSTSSMFQDLSPACLLIGKQDVHWNKFDIDGNNSIEKRFADFTLLISKQLDRVQKLHNLDKIIYVVGSDEFNSEWTSQTTKGTPQQNILTYQEAFEKVSKYSISFIKYLLSFTRKVEVVLLNGNHDHNVSWHLANLLSHVFSETTNVSVDTELKNTKVLEYGDNLILINHGDEMKPKELASKFPIIAKDKWSQYNNFTVISGDKHHEVAHDYNGVRTYQLPQLSKAKSAWDDKKGHICSKAELVTFLFDEKELSLILKNEI